MEQFQAFNSHIHVFFCTRRKQLSLWRTFVRTCNFSPKRTSCVETSLWLNTTQRHGIVFWTKLTILNILWPLFWCLIWYICRWRSSQLLWHSWPQWRPTYYWCHPNMMVSVRWRRSGLGRSTVLKVNLNNRSGKGLALFLGMPSC